MCVIIDKADRRLDTRIHGRESLCHPNQVPSSTPKRRDRTSATTNPVVDLSPAVYSTADWCRVYTIKGGIGLFLRGRWARLGTKP